MVAGVHPDDVVCMLMQQRAACQQNMQGAQKGCLQPLVQAGTIQAVTHGPGAYPYSSALLLAVTWLFALSVIGALLALPISGRALQLCVPESATATRKEGFQP